MAYIPKQNIVQSDYGLALETIKELTTITRASEVTSGVQFVDAVCMIDFNQMQYYFLTFALGNSIKRAVEVEIKLAVINEGKVIEGQLLKKVSLEANQLETAQIQLVVNPQHNTDYNAILFEIVRTTEDYGTLDNQGAIVVKNAELYSFVNQLNADNNEVAAKVGVKGKPGQILCLNGEQIFIGRSGVYEVLCGIDISFIGVGPSDTPTVIDYIQKDEGV